MEWIVERQGQRVVELTTSDELVDWLNAHAEGPPVAGLDAYRDRLLDPAAVTSWVRALRAVRKAASDRVRSQLESSGRLPRSPDARARILADLIAQSLARDPGQRALADLLALFELAAESGATVRLVGD